MSSVNPVTFGPSRYTLWIADRDDDGSPVDPRFIDAAYEIGPRLFSYRREEIGCESVTSSLIQSAVNAASKAAINAVIDNPFGYLLTVFTRKVDRYLSRFPVEVTVEAEFLEDAANQSERADAVITLLNNRILADRALSLMSPEVQELCDLHIIHGLPMKEIAALKGEPSNRLHVRLTRGLKRVAEVLRSNQSNRRESKVDG